MKHEHEETARETETELEKANAKVSEEEVYTEMVKKEDCNKELERRIRTEN